MNQQAGALTASRLRPTLERRCTTRDGTGLFYRCWPATSGRRKGAILLFHRGHEHSGRMAHLVDELDLPEFAFYAWDQRGHGRSERGRGAASSFAAVVGDVHDFVRHVAQADGVATEEMALVAQSMGAVLAAAWAHDYAPRIRAMVLAAPAFAVRLYIPFALPGLRLLRRLRGDFLVNSYVKARLLTQDPERIASFEQDGLITRPIAVGMLLGLHETAQRIVRDARAITVPTQLLIAGSDVVVKQGPQHQFFVNLGAATKERHVLPGFYHDLLGEKARAPVVRDVRRFLTERFARPIERPALLDAHRFGYTRDEADRLGTPLPIVSLRGAYWAASRAGLKFGALLSHGLAVGRRTGFDSGSMLDYVYRNRAGGLWPVGPVLDRTYLDAPGWRGIRQRKLNVEALLAEAMRRLDGEGRPVDIMDIAAGHGRYVVEALARAPIRPNSVLLRDYSDLNVEAGTRLIAENGLADIATFRKGDAFDPDSLAAVRPQPTLGIVSGLYELFPDNDLVRRSLSGLARAVPAGGYLVYTCQPWHPQLELIARALTSHRQGQAWVMRRRTQAEMDELVEDAGFAKVEQLIDEWGIFTVSLARRVGDQSNGGDGRLPV
jgi:alpha-beta hydrolase superfamily lysophospholipase